MRKIVMGEEPYKENKADKRNMDILLKRRIMDAAKAPFGINMFHLNKITRER